MDAYWLPPAEEERFPRIPIKEELKLVRSRRLWRYMAILLAVALVLVLVFK